ncbi:hypothetical protein E2562_013206 [Oryza meyeriana var. granulata]|uniref:H15 domain-containing protein n=1 Tax=Oryza meyeriana var. granulata TaxID=110450 RepID=A0A6G1DJ57_9ORYZ|nr:hypothetical protein E2562_013206 [Oryza meyeriana var. granulata]
MIVEAIETLNNGIGSNNTAIEGYIEGKYGTKLSCKHSYLVLGHLPHEGQWKLTIISIIKKS